MTLEILIMTISIDNGGGGDDEAKDDGDDEDDIETNVKITHKQATLKPVGPMMRVFSSGRLSRIGGIALFVGKQKNAFLPVST